MPGVPAPGERDVVDMHPVPQGCIGIDEAFRRLLASGPRESRPRDRASESKSLDVPARIYMERFSEEDIRAAWLRQQQALWRDELQAFFTDTGGRCVRAPRDYWFSHDEWYYDDRHKLLPGGRVAKTFDTGTLEYIAGDLQSWAAMAGRPAYLDEAAFMAWLEPCFAAATRTCSETIAQECSRQESCRQFLSPTRRTNEGRG